MIFDELSKSNSKKTLPVTIEKRIFCEKSNVEYYVKAIDLISKDQDIRKGFVFLKGRKALHKKNFYNGMFRIKINDFLYTPDFDVPNLICFDSKELVEDLNIDEKTSLKTLSTENNYKFVVFFSKMTSNYFECKIVSSVDSTIDNDYFIRTRFGKVLKLYFCIENNRIIKHDMKLFMAG